MTEFIQTAIQLVNHVEESAASFQGLQFVSWPTDVCFCWHIL